MKTPALILLAAAVIPPVASANPGDGVKPPAGGHAEAPTRKVQELQKERVATLEKLVDVASANFRNARGSYEDVLKAQLQLLQARLDAAEKAADRIALYKQAIDSLKKSEELARTRVESGRGTEAAVLGIKAQRLEVEIQLERAKAREAEAGK